ncbi:MAG: S-layer homology domain-containing protein, partial [Clostridiales bacterium]|nr:S-layer homology domain-containing protein [Clostridiales bacterium]
MKNLKKILALALVFAFSLTLFAGAAFTDDADIGDEYKDDVSMLVELKILGGYPEGDFRPNGNITRAEFCKMVYVLMYGADSDGSLFGAQTSKFNDVGDHWAKGYINYCANQNIVGGYGDGTFKPDGNITVAEVSKMLLVLLGCDPAKEGFGGSNWIGNVVSKAMGLGVYDGWVGNSTELATRQLVAKLMRNTIFAPVYRYNAFTGAGSQYNMDDEENKTLGETVMGLIHVTGQVVANEHFYIKTDKDGELINDLLDNGNISTAREDHSYILYYTEDNDAKLLEVDRALEDTMLGCMVDVYFRAKGNENRYSQVEVIGNVLLNAKTKAYDVLSKDI